MALFTKKTSSFSKIILISSIRFYQRFLSHWLGGRCRFFPTCSHYALEAIEKKGVRYGLYLAIKRIFRCQPFCKGGLDPLL